MRPRTPLVSWLGAAVLNAWLAGASARADVVVMPVPYHAPGDSARVASLDPNAPPSFARFEGAFLVGLEQPLERSYFDLPDDHGANPGAGFAFALRWNLDPRWSLGLRTPVGISYTRAPYGAPITAGLADTTRFLVTTASLQLELRSTLGGPRWQRYVSVLGGLTSVEADDGFFATHVAGGGDLGLAVGLRRVFETTAYALEFWATTGWARWSDLPEPQSRGRRVQPGAVAVEFGFEHRWLRR